MANGRAHVAQHVESGYYYEAEDVFTCGLGLFVLLCPAGARGMDAEMVLAEILDLDGRKARDMIKTHSRIPPADIIEDYILAATSDLIARGKAEQRYSAYACDERGLAAVDVKQARTLAEAEAALGCPIMEHAATKKAVYVHKMGDISRLGAIGASEADGIKMPPTVKDAAVGYESDLIFDFVDAFSYKGGVYAVMKPRFYKGGGVQLMEIISLSGGEKLGRGLEDYFFLLSFDKDAQQYAMERQERGLASPDALGKLDKTGARTKKDAERALGGGVLEAKSKASLYVHKRI